MRRPLLLLLLLAALGHPGLHPLLAGPNSGGVLLLHANLALPFTFDADWREWSELRDCKDAVTQVPGDEEGVIFYVLAAWPFGAPTMRAICFGIKYSSQLVAPVAWGANIHPNEYDQEYQSSTWPMSGSGTTLVWAEPRTDSVSEIYWFASYAYDGNTFQLTPHPDPDLGGHFCDDSTQPVLDEIESYGMLGFGSKLGFNPCGGEQVTGGCCTSSGQCLLRTRNGCLVNAGATYLGDNSGCSPNPCEPGMGACCFGPDCRLMNSRDCLGDGGEFNFATGCDPTPCDYGRYEANWGQIKSRYRNQ